MAKIVYTVVVDQVEFDTMGDAKKAAYKLNSDFRNQQLEGITFRVGYYQKQPEYKKWVPNWVIKMLLK